MMNLKTTMRRWPDEANLKPEWCLIYSHFVKPTRKANCSTISMKNKLSLYVILTDVESYGTPEEKIMAKFNISLEEKVKSL